MSIEVDPRLAQEAERTVAEARQLWWLVDRPNLFIKIPATEASLPAISQCLAEGISVNVTLIFSLERYRAVMEAFLDGMERARAAGHDLTHRQSVASFFVSRVDTEIDKRLDKLGSTEAVAARQGRDRQRAARLPGLRAGLRQRALDRAGGGRGQAAAAAVGVDRRQGPVVRRHDVRRRARRPRRRQHDARGDPGRRADHGVIRGDTVRGEYASAAATMQALADIGIDVDDVVRVLEDEAVEKFETSWNDLLTSTKAELERLAKAGGQ